MLRMVPQYVCDNCGARDNVAVLTLAPGHTKWIYGRYMSRNEAAETPGALHVCTSDCRDALKARMAKQAAEVLA